MTHTIGIKSGSSGPKPHELPNTLPPLLLVRLFHGYMYHKIARFDILWFCMETGALQVYVLCDYSF